MINEKSTPESITSCGQTFPLEEIEAAGYLFKALKFYLKGTNTGYEDLTIDQMDEVTLELHVVFRSIYGFNGFNFDQDKLFDIFKFASDNQISPNENWRYFNNITKLISNLNRSFRAISAFDSAFDRINSPKKKKSDIYQLYYRSPTNTLQTLRQWSIRESDQKKRLNNGERPGKRSKNF